MRRIIIIGTVLAAFGGGAAALAASDANTYGGSITVSPKKTGSRTHPVPVGWNETITVKSNQPGMNAAPLKKIVTKIYGFTVNTKALPTCSASKIQAAKNDNVCNPKAMVASGSIQSELGQSSRQGPTAPCDPLLHVWNAGNNKVVYFFVISGTHQCVGLQTGSANPYTGTFTRSGKYLVLTVPLPPDVSTEAGGLPNTYGSLVYEQLTWKRAIGKVKGKKVGYFSTVGCKAHKRPYSSKYIDTTGSSTVSGKAAC